MIVIIAIVEIVLKFELKTQSINSLVVVFPLLPVNAITMDLVLFCESCKFCKVSMNLLLLKFYYYLYSQN